MVDNNQKNKSISVENYGIENAKVKYQLSSEELHNEILVKGQGKEASSGAIAVNTGEFTGRSPKDRFIVKMNIKKDKGWWGKEIIPFQTKMLKPFNVKLTKYLSEK